MTSGQPLEISQNNSLPKNNAGKEFVDRLVQMVIVSLLAATAFIH